MIKKKEEQEVVYDPIQLIMDEGEEGDKFRARGTVVYSKPPEKRNGPKGPFYTQFVLMQDDSTGYERENKRLALSLLLDESSQKAVNGEVLDVSGRIKEYNDKLQYEGKILRRKGGEVQEPKLNGDKPKVPNKVPAKNGSKNGPKFDSKEEERAYWEEKDRKSSVRMAKSVAVKAVAEMVAGKKLNLDAFWDWTKQIAEYVQNAENTEPTVEDLGEQVENMTKQVFQDNEDNEEENADDVPF